MEWRTGHIFAPLLRVEGRKGKREEVGCEGEEATREGREFLVEDSGPLCM